MSIIRLGVSQREIQRTISALPESELKESPGKGKGVFATDDIRKDRFATQYPFHALASIPENSTPGEVAPFQILGVSRGTEVTEELLRVLLYSNALSWHYWHWRS